MEKILVLMFVLLEIHDIIRVCTDTSHYKRKITTYSKEMVIIEQNYICYNVNKSSGSRLSSIDCGAHCSRLPVCDYFLFDPDSWKMCTLCVYKYNNISLELSDSNAHFVVNGTSEIANGKKFRIYRRNTKRKVYILHTDLLSWQDAWLECNKQEAELVSIDSVHTWDVVIKPIADASGCLSIWTSAINISGVWVWSSNGDVLENSLWATGEPTYDGNCLDLLQFRGYKFNDRPCSVETCYMCEMVLAP